jgi:hypothetical protein
MRAKHLPRYFAEFTYRSNGQEQEDILMMMPAGVSSSETLPHCELVAEAVKQRTNSEHILQHSLT